MMKAAFFGKNGRVRSGWRALIFLVAFFVCATAILLVRPTINFALSGLFASESSFVDASTAANFFLLALAATIVGVACGRLFEGLPFRALGLSFTRGWLSHLAMGLAIGAGSLLVAVIMAITSGSMSLGPNSTSPSASILLDLGASLLIMSVAAAFEEILMRGYVLQTFFRSDLKGFGVMLTAFLFASGHMSNPNFAFFPWLNTLLAGIWFAVAYLKTRDLWFPFGIHLAWNWLQGPVFGISVSGISGFASDPLFRATDNGPAWLTGGSYGIEGGVACTLALLVSTAMIWLIPGLNPNEELLALTSSKPSVS